LSSPVGVLAMAYGTASGPEDVERYYTDIRGGRPPSPDHLEELKSRYAAIGNRFPLLAITRRQGQALEHELNAGEGRYAVYLGMKHSPPFIADAVEQMRSEGIERAVGLVLAPHWSGMSVETYVDRVEKALAEAGAGGVPSFRYVRHWYDHPSFVEFLAGRVAAALEGFDETSRARPAVVFSAHSLPTRRLPDGGLRCKLCDLCADSCRYVRQLAHTAELVAGRLAITDQRIAWQSAGRTTDQWWGPPVGEVIRGLATAGHTAVVVCSAGFVADHLEILYDLDIEARRVAADAGIAFARTEMPNDHPDFIRTLAEVVRSHLDTEERK
jgi:ferrochelatase